MCYCEWKKQSKAEWFLVRSDTPNWKYEGSKLISLWSKFSDSSFWYSMKFLGLIYLVQKYGRERLILIAAKKCHRSNYRVQSWTWNVDLLKKIRINRRFSAAQKDVCKIESHRIIERSELKGIIKNHLILSAAMITDIFY